MHQVDRARHFFTLVGLAGALLFAGSVSAQSVAEPKSWTATPFLSGSMGLDQEGAGNSLALGVGIGYDLTRNIGFEGELSHLFDITGDDENIDWSVTNFSGNFLYHFDVRHSVTPYATFGLGFEHSGVDVKNPESLALVIPSSTELAFNFGGGVKYPIAQKLLVRADLRRFESNDLAPDYWRVYAGLTWTIGRQ
jgi:opacity protein-like surface antigen